MSAADYNRRGRQGGTITDADLAKLLERMPGFDQELEAAARAWQKARGLEVDGRIGPATLASLRARPRFWPLVTLPDGRKPIITSAFKTENPSRPSHNGIDLFYRWLGGDPKVPAGEGLFDKKGNRTYWYPPKGFCKHASLALAAAAGKVTIAGKITTGYRCWVDHGDGTRTGYFHLADLFAKVGDLVEGGAPLGVVGYSPKDAGKVKHLHFEVSPSGAYAPANPRTWLAGAGYFPAPGAP